MIYLIVFLISLLAAALQLTFFAKLAFFSFSPNLILAGILAYAIWRRDKKNKWLVLIPALFLDFLVGRPFGLLTLAFWTAFCLVEWLARILFRQNNLPAIVSLTVLGVLFFEIFLTGETLLAGILHLTSRVNFEGFYFYGIIPLSILGNGILCLIFVFLFQKFTSPSLIRKK